MYILGILLAFLYLTEKFDLDQEKLLYCACAAIVWPVMVLGLVWVNRELLKNMGIVFLDLLED